MSTLPEWRVGVDEAGRGPLAGPVAVGVFAVTQHFDMRQLEGIQDSKVLSPKKREAWFDVLTALPHATCAVSLCGPRYIDTCGIVRAVQLAMKRALDKCPLDPPRTQVRLDGSLRAPAAYEHQQTIIGGDATDPLISAAAILAKVTRDRYMLRIAEQYPEYGFREHKGYGTAYHRSMIQAHGPCPVHRLTFCRGIR